ncbi:hypothetical protein F2P56_011304 [Juglans regia]|uniref:Leucine-rich repeat-containing N-terminal plant-type domain-containing protein n=1 Tax=Juglans regia TaxID=51240 RepID=A0A834CXP3_JUGRE|nr:hypothetical protein F2P56_011304 [Juglans regia]
MLSFTPHDLLFILLLLVILIANNACNQADLNSLMSLKAASTSSPPLNWSSNDCCHWEGSIPGWLSTLPRLKALQLSHNLISGEFPKELCALPALVSAQAYQRDNDYLLLPIYYLDNNKVIGQYNSLSYWYPRLYFMNNSLSGKIPIEIGRLKLLRALHLGHNNFTGNIPDQISELTDLEELDLSANQLSGEIPASLARLHFLATFSVAYNNLHGQIPSGTQLQGFDTSAYEGNLGLCGTPLPRCDHITNGNKDKDIQNEKDGRTIPWFHITVMLGFITGFWAVCGPLAFNRNWRDSYFRYLNNLKDQFYVAFAVSLATLHRRRWPYAACTRDVYTLQLDHEDYFKEITIQKGIGNVELLNGPTTNDANGENEPYSLWFDYENESLTVVKYWLLVKLFGHKTGFVVLDSTIGIVLLVVDLFVANDVHGGSGRDK